MLVYVTAAGAVLALAFWLPDLADWERTDWFAAAALAGVIVLVQQVQIPLRHRTETENFSMVDAVWAASLLLVRPSVLVAAVAVGVSVGQAARGWHPHKTAFNVSQDVIAISLALVVYGSLAGPAAEEPRAWAAATAGMLAYFVVNVTAVPLAIAITERTSFREILFSVAGLNLLQAAGNVALGILVAVVALRVPAALPLLAVPLFLSWFAYTGWLRSMGVRQRMDEMARAADEIATGEDFDRRLPDVDAPDELSLLSRTLNRMLERIEGSLRREHRFLNEVSHELRTPLTICYGHLEVLDTAPSTEEVAELREVMLSELARMGRLVEDMTTLARAENPGFVRPEPISLEEFLADIAARATPLLNGGLRLDPPPSGTLVQADPQRLTQALLNLLQNAALHGGADGDVLLRVSRETDAWRFEVADNGPGLTAEQAGKVFEPFARGRTAAAGSGLGLAIVRGIAEAHGGTAGVESRPGHGATFWIRVPQ